MNVLPEYKELGLPYITETIARGKIIDLVAIALSYVQLALLIMIIISGFRWMFSFGDTEKTRAATRAIFHAIIGYVIIYFSYSLVAWIQGVLS